MHTTSAASKSEFRQSGGVNVNTVIESASGPTFSMNEAANVAIQVPGNLPSRPSSGGCVPSFKDQVQNVDPQRPAIAAGHQQGFDDGDRERAASFRPRHDPPAESRHVNAVANPVHGDVAPEDVHKPHVKDQCRNAPAEGMNNYDPPLASAVVVEETIEQVAPDLRTINL